MNIFFLNLNPRDAARSMCDKHVVVMSKESAQLLSTAHRVLDGDDHADSVGMYKKTHVNHPSAVWVRESFENYLWLFNHFDELLKEYTYRYGKIHATSRLLYPLSVLPNNIGGDIITPIPLCMADEYKIGDAVESYRQYYRVGKKDLLKWTNREQPDWINNG